MILATLQSARQAMLTLDSSMPIREVKCLYDFFDDDGSGNLEYREFSARVRSLSATEVLSFMSARAEARIIEAEETESEASDGTDSDELVASEPPLSFVDRYSHLQRPNKVKPPKGGHAYKEPAAPALASSTARLATARANARRTRSAHRYS